MEIATNRLYECELIIKKGLHTFYEVGNALTEIRDSKLYKETHLTFEGYCIEKWNIKKRHAYKLMDAFSVTESVH